MFTILAERTYQYAAENGYRFVIGVANAQSTHGFIKNLDFKLIGPLDFKIGLGMNIYPQCDYTFTRYWDQELEIEFDKDFKSDAVTTDAAQAFTLILFEDSDVTDYENYEGYYAVYTGTSANTGNP